MLAEFRDSTLSCLATVTHGEILDLLKIFLTSRSLLPCLGNSPVFVSRGKEFGHDVDIIFTTLELGKEENLLLDVIKSLEKQVRLKNSLFLLHVDGK